MTKPKTKQIKAEILDNRQAELLKLFLDPTNSLTYQNIQQSAIAAGYSESYAKNLNNQVNWLSDSIGTVTKDELVKKAKKVLNKTLDGDDIKLAQDTAKFVAKTDIEFSEKTDITTGGDKIQPLLVKFIGDVNVNVQDK